MTNELEIDERFIKSGSIAAKVRDYFKNKDLVGMTVNQVCTEVEDMTRKLGAEPGFPCGVSINSITAHYSGELFDEQIIQNNDVIKLDLGAHIDGYVADTATTICYNPEYQELTLATEAALNEAIRSVKNKISSSEIGKIISNTANKFGFKPIENLSGHSIERFKIHAGVSIPNVWTPFGSSLKTGNVYAIEPFLTVNNGSGHVVDGKTKTIYMLLKRKKTGDKKYLDAVCRVVGHFNQVEPSWNYNYNMMLTEAALAWAQATKSYDKVSAKLQTQMLQSTLREQRPWGGWAGHNSRIGYHCANMSAFCQLHQTLTEDKKHVAMRTEIKRRVIAALNRMIREQVPAGGFPFNHGQPGTARQNSGIVPALIHVHETFGFEQARQLLYGQMTYLSTDACGKYYWLPRNRNHLEMSLLHSEGLYLEWARKHPG